MNKLIIIFFLIFSLTVLNANKDKIYVIANSSVEQAGIDRITLAEIYLLNKQHWDNSDRITVIDYSGENDTRNKFYSGLDLTVKKIKKLWLKKQFTGSAMPPITCSKQEEMLVLVKNTKNAIGYIKSDTKPSDVITLYVFD